MRRTLFAALAAVLLLPASALAKDRNHDKLPDRWEKAHSLSLKHDQARRDQDHDGVRNLAEYRHGLDPRDADSDDDGRRDGAEAGRIRSFDAATGVLVVSLIDGTELSGVVNSTTEIKCHDGVASASRHGDDDPAGDDHGGDDRGGDDVRDDDRACSTDALSAGARVHEAELEVTSAGSVWDEIELV